jgi:hypothetical protein
VAVLWNPADPAKALEVREIQATGQALGVQPQLLEVRGPEDFESAFAAMTNERAEALITLGDPLTVSHRMRIVDLAAKSQLPTMYDVREFVEAGGLMAYGPSLPNSSPAVSSWCVSNSTRRVRNRRTAAVGGKRRGWTPSSSYTSLMNLYEGEPLRCMVTKMASSKTLTATVRTIIRNTINALFFRSCLNLPICRGRP